MCILSVKFDLLFVSTASKKNWIFVSLRNKANTKITNTNKFETDIQSAPNFIQIDVYLGLNTNP